MSALTFELPAAVVQEYQVLSDAARRQFGFELVFRLGQYSRSATGSTNFAAILDKAQAQARRNGLTEVGHAA